MPKKPLLPTSDLAKRFCKVMHRRETTAWQDKEVRSFRFIRDSVHEDDMLILERYYASNWPPESNKNHLRHDLYTLLNNYAGEVDRARIWCEKHPLRSERKIIPMPTHRSDEPVVTAEPEVVEKFLVEYREHKARKGIA